MDHEKYLRDLVKEMIDQGASDLHISSLRAPLIRISGELKALAYEAPKNDDMASILTSIVGKEKFAIFSEKLDLDFSYDYDENARLRGHAFIQKTGISLVFRLIPKIKSLAELQLPPMLEQFALARQGFFLVVGPVGQGKTTTLASMINIINEKRAAHIVTIEDPIEHIYDQKKSLIDQREVGIEAHSFESALTSAFREDVNVILIGEMRTRETMATAVTAAETGHLVLATLHTNNASQTIDRIIDSFPAEQQDQIRVQLAASLLGVFSQRLVPKITGGRIPAYELLINTPAVSNLIREKRTHEIDVVIETGTDQGMVDMNRSLVELVRNGEITQENAFAYSANPRALTQLL